jgi:hypothetical protein
VADLFSLGVPTEEDLREKIMVDVMLVWYQALKREVMGVPLLRHVMFFVAEDRPGYLCLFP